MSFKHPALPGIRLIRSLYLCLFVMSDLQSIFILEEPSHATLVKVRTRSSFDKDFKIFRLLMYLTSATMLSSEKLRLTGLSCHSRLDQGPAMSCRTAVAVGFRACTCTPRRRSIPPDVAPTDRLAFGRPVTRGSTLGFRGPVERPSTQLHRPSSTSRSLQLRGTAKGLRASNIDRSVL